MKHDDDDDDDDDDAISIEHLDHLLFWNCQTNQATNQPTSLVENGKPEDRLLTFASSLGRLANDALATQLCSNVVDPIVDLLSGDESDFIYFMGFP